MKQSGDNIGTIDPNKSLASQINTLRLDQSKLWENMTDEYRRLSEEKTNRYFPHFYERINVTVKGKKDARQVFIKIRYEDDDTTVTDQPANINDFYQFPRAFAIFRGIAIDGGLTPIETLRNLPNGEVIVDELKVAGMNTIDDTVKFLNDLSPEAKGRYKDFEAALRKRISGIYRNDAESVLRSMKSGTQVDHANEGVEAGLDDVIAQNAELRKRIDALESNIKKSSASKKQPQSKPNQQAKDLLG